MRTKKILVQIGELVFGSDYERKGVKQGHIYYAEKGITNGCYIGAHHFLAAEYEVVKISEPFKD